MILFDVHLQEGDAMQPWTVKTVEPLKDVRFWSNFTAPKIEIAGSTKIDC